MKPIVFLDVDGVLNHGGCYARFGEAMGKLTLEEAERGYGDDINAELLFAEDCVARLNRLTAEVGAEIVLSSSWRMLYWDKREKFQRLARRVGVAAPIVDFTPRRGQGGIMRGDEIETWLRANRTEARIVVIDDDSDMLAVEPWFVQTDGAVGLQERDVDRALRVLRGRSWRRP